VSVLELVDKDVRPVMEYFKVKYRVKGGPGSEE